MCYEEGGDRSTVFNGRGDDSTVCDRGGVIIMMITLKNLFHISSYKSISMLKFLKLPYLPYVRTYMYVVCTFICMYT